LKTIKTPDLCHFESFITVAEQGSFTRAAAILKISKTVLSQKIKALETATGVTLLARTTRKVALTEEGQLLYTQCLRLQQELTATKNLMNGWHDQPHGLLTVSCNPYISEHILLPLITRYRQHYPQVTVEVLIEERMPDMTQENVDVILGVNWPAPDTIVRRQMGATRYVLCANPEYLAQYGTPQTLDDMRHHLYIHHTGRQRDLPIMGLRDNQRSPTLTIELSSNDARFMRACALAGQGIVELHEYMVRDALDAGHLVEVLPHVLEAEQPLYVYYRKDRFVQPKIRQFITMLMTQAESPQSSTETN